MPYREHIGPPCTVCRPAEPSPLRVLVVANLLAASGMAAAMATPVTPVSARASLRRASVTLGEPILVDLHLRNDSQEELRVFILGGQAGPFLAVVGATKEQAEPREDAPQRRFTMGIQASLTLPVGRDVVVTGILNKYVRIRLPGVYRVSVSWEGIPLPRPQRSGKVASGKRAAIKVKEHVTVQVLPASFEVLRQRARELAGRAAHCHDWSEVRVLAEALGVIEHPLVIPFLVETLQADNAAAASRAVEALGRFDEAEAVEGVLKAVSHRDCDVRAAAVRAGSRYRDRPKFQNAFVGALDDSDYTVRQRAVRMLTGTTSPALWRRFAELLRDREQGVRIAAADALGKTGDPSVVGDLQIAFDGERESMARKHIKASLTVLAHPPEPLPEDARSLTKMLDSHHLDERTAAVRKLGKLNTPEARQGLVYALKSECFQTRFDAITQVKQLKCQEAADTLIGLMGHPDPITRMLATVALGEMRHTRAAPAMARLLFDSERNVRRAVPNSLSLLGDPSVIPMLKKALKDEKDREVAKKMRSAIKYLERRQEGKKEGLTKPK